MRCLWLPALVAVLVVCPGCGREPQQAPPVSPTAPSGQTSHAAPSWPSSSAEAPACQVLLTATVGDGDDQRSVHVYAQNLTEEVLTFEIPERCPDGPIDFEGLGPGYDYYGTCGAGADACQGWPLAREITVHPGQQHLVSGGYMPVKGSSCAGLLAPGTHTLRPVPPVSTVALCAEPTTFEVKRPVSPEQAAARAGDPYFCQESADCVLSCPTTPKCCGEPCGCTHAINVRHKAAYEASYPKTCARPPCAAVACLHQPARSAVCRDNRCVGTDSMVR